MILEDEIHELSIKYKDARQKEKHTETWLYAQQMSLLVKELIIKKICTHKWKGPTIPALCNCCNLVIY